jgi:hypothetical protein
MKTFLIWLERLLLGLVAIVVAACLFGMVHQYAAGKADERIIRGDRRSHSENH